MPWDMRMSLKYPKVRRTSQMQSGQVLFVSCKGYGMILAADGTRVFASRELINRNGLRENEVVEFEYEESVKGHAATRINGVISRQDGPVPQEHAMG